MKTYFALFVLSFFYPHCLAASVDTWSSPLKERTTLKYEAIEPEVVKARIGTTPGDNSEGGRESGMVYFCREENWGAPCFAYRPELEYTCNELGPELKGHIGSVFVDPGMICRLAGFTFDYLSSEDLQSNVTPAQKTMTTQPSLEDTTRFGRTYPLTPVKARIRPQIDSPAEDRYSESPSPSTKPPRVERRSKRKSSVMSLRSLTEGVKRTRAGVEKLAHNICYNSCSKLRHAHQSVRRQHKEQRKHYSVWKALRRKLRPEDASKPKHEKASASFSIEQGGRGTESWWNAGVEKYHAPKWMRFGK
nr:hypothetical protein FVER53263_04123 [Fusarium verticillioides]